MFTFDDGKSLEMKVFVNGESKELPEGLTLSQMVDHLVLPARRMAIEVNKHVIRKQDWNELKIAERDEIEIVHFVGGG